MRGPHWLKRITGIEDRKHRQRSPIAQTATNSRAALRLLGNDCRVVIVDAVPYSRVAISLAGLGAIKLHFGLAIRANFIDVLGTILSGAVIISSCE